MNEWINENVHKKKITILNPFSRAVVSSTAQQQPVTIGLQVKRNDRVDGE